MFICKSCRQALRQGLRTQLTVSRFASTTSRPTARDILSKPTWSVRSLLESSPDTPKETISSKQLHHLLRLSALPPPKTKAEEDSMIETLQNQLQFVRAVQSVDTTGVEPLRAIRDETDQGVKEITVTLESLKPLLGEETLVGHYQRPRRVKKKVESEAENWDSLSMASRKSGRFFVVKSDQKDQDEGSG